MSYLVVAVGLLLEPVYIQDLCNPNDGDPVSMAHEGCTSRSSRPRSKSRIKIDTPAEIGHKAGGQARRDWERRRGDRGEGCGTLTEAVGVGVLKLSEKEAAKHIAASMVTPNVATALARCPKECILSRLRFLRYRAAAAEIAGPALPLLLLFLPPVAAAPATSL